MNKRSILGLSITSFRWLLVDEAACDLSVHRAPSGTLDSVNLGVHSHDDLWMGLDS